MDGNQEDNNINGNNVVNTILKSNGKILGKYFAIFRSMFYHWTQKKIFKSIHKGFIAKDSFNIVYWHKK